jgi:hypothetical protein
MIRSSMIWDEGGSIGVRGKDGLFIDVSRLNLEPADSAAVIG